MSNKTQLSTNNTKLASLIQELQGKAAGGGSGAAETCTVNVIGASTAYRPYYISYTTVDDSGNLSSQAIGPNSSASVTLENVACGSVVTVRWYGFVTFIGNKTSLLLNEDKYFAAYSIDASAGETADIINQNSGGSVQ